MVMPITMMVATGVTVNDGAVEEHRQHLFHGKLESTSVDADAEAYTKNKHTPATLTTAPTTSRSVTF